MADEGAEAEEEAALEDVLRLIFVFSFDLPVEDLEVDLLEEDLPLVALLPLPALDLGVVDLPAAVLPEATFVVDAFPELVLLEAALPVPDLLVLDFGLLDAEDPLALALFLVSEEADAEVDVDADAAVAAVDVDFGVLAPPEGDFFGTADFFDDFLVSDFGGETPFGSSFPRDPPAPDILMEILALPPPLDVDEEFFGDDFGDVGFVLLVPAELG